LTKKALDTFSTYFELGLRHIADLDAYDHMLFLLALICVYQLIDGIKILILVTAFTLGHSLTLFLATTDILRVNDDWVEFLIPVTILFTSISHLVRGRKAKSDNMFWPYFFAAFFGLIHGLGFSNYLRMLLREEGELFIPLLAFNIGIEVGQVLIVVAILILYELLFRLLRFKHREWILVVSGATAGISLILMKEAAFW